MTTDPREASLVELEQADPFQPHDPGCHCWPHVSQRAAVEAAVQAATTERRAALAPDPREALQRIVDVINDVERGYADQLEQVHFIARAALAQAVPPPVDVDVLNDALGGMGVIDNGTWVSFNRVDAERIAELYAVHAALRSPDTEENR